MGNNEKSPIIYALIGGIVMLIVINALLVAFSLRTPDSTSVATVTSTSVSTQETRSSAPETTTSVEPVKQDRCSIEAATEAFGVSTTRIHYCDDNWLYVGQDGSDYLKLFTWDTGRWVERAPDGEYFTKLGCYKPEPLKAAGAPQALLNELPLCETSPQCDGRWILIAESVLVPAGQDPDGYTSAALQKWPGASVIPARTCSSMHASYEGQDVYAVYYDAGHSVSEVCALKAKYGGNARSLNNAGDFSDPC